MNINNIVNIGTSALSESEQHFIAEIASLFEPWGMAVMSARVYGYILLNQAPVSVNRIAADLQTSKVGAWKAARDLEAFGHIRRYGEPGSKRALYGPTDNFAAPLLRQCALLAALGRVMQQQASSTDKAGVATRLKKMSHFYTSLGRTMEATIRGVNGDKPAKK